MSLSPETKKRYRTIGHGLKPVVTVAGKGLSEGVIAELGRALDDHELIKVKLAMEDREERKQAIADLCSQTGAELVQTIGKIVLIFREARKPKLATSNIR
jgi:putative RNA-binding protein, YhbY family